MPLDYVAERDMLISTPSLSSSHGVGSQLSAPSSSRTRLLFPFPFSIGGQLKALLTSISTLQGSAFLSCPAFNSHY